MYNNIMAKVKKKKLIKETHAKLYIGAGANNTILSLTKHNGDLITQVSSGSCGFENCRKSTPHAMQTAVTTMMKKSVEHGVKFMQVTIKGIGAARDMVSLLTGHGIVIESLEDITNPAYNGCTKSREKRG